MKANVKKWLTSAATAVAIGLISLTMVGNATAAKKLSPAQASPPPSWGYLGSPPIVIDYALAQSWNLEYPFYTQQIFNYCDYRNCTLQFRNGSWVPVWYGPAR